MQNIYISLISFILKFKGQKVTFPLASVVTLRNLCHRNLAFIINIGNLVNIMAVKER